MGADETWTRRQRDTFFAVPKGWLKLREQAGDAPELIAYTRPRDHGGPRASDYERMPLEDASRWLALLGRALEREVVVEKERTLWLWRHTRVHLDRVEGLGEYLELETVLDGIDAAQGHAETDEAIAALALDRATFLAVPYRDLLASGASRSAAQDEERVP